METLTDADRALYIAPDGLVDSFGHEYWNADPACCDFDGANPDDVGYLGGILDDVIAEWPVDPSAVFVIGHSNGGYMTYRMACERADVISAISPLAGDASSMPANCNPVHPVSVLHLHGTADTAVPYDGGMGGVSGIGAVGSVEQWASHDGCGTTRTPTVTLDLDSAVAGSETHGETTDGCPSKVAVDLWTLEGSTHIPVFPTSIAGTLLDWLLDHKR
jgi:polyhydroxybutyrate depolymerase